MDFNTAEHGKLIDSLLDSDVPVTLKNYPLLSFSLVAKKNISNCQKSYKRLLPFPRTWTRQATFCSYTSVKTTCHNISNSEANVTVQLPSIKPDIKKIYKNVK